MKRILTLALALALFAGSAPADDLLLKDGRTLTGKVVDEGKRYTIVDRDRIYAVAKSDVQSIETGRCLMNEYDERLAALPVEDAEAIFEFGLWLKESDWESRARRAFEEVLSLDADHRGARRELGYQLYEGEWVSPDELNRRKGLVEFEGRWYTKHDHAELLAEIGRDEKLKQAIEYRRQVNEKVNRIAGKFATYDKKQRQGAYDELSKYAEQLNSPELRKFAEDSKAYYDSLVKHYCARMLARTEIHATHTKLKKPIDNFETTLGAAVLGVVSAQNPVKIQLPELSIVEVNTTVDIPAGCK